MFELNNLCGVLIPALFAFAWSKPDLYIQESIKLYIALFVVSAISGIWSIAVNVIHLGLSELDIPSDSYIKIAAYINTFNIPPVLAFMPVVVFIIHVFLVWFSGRLVAHAKQ